MPLLLRSVEPSHISRGTLPDRFKVQNDLEAVANGTLSNVIRQLSSLSHYAQELFTDLISVGTEIATRANNLQARVDRLAVRVSQIDSIQEESSIQDSLNTKPFTSALSFDQQVVARSNLPAAMSKTFELCDKPPPLDKLNVYRDDGRDGLKFYTDPSYFFDLWRQEMLKDTERAIDKGRKPHKPKHEGQNRHKKRVRQPPNTRERQRHLAIEQGEHLMPVSTTHYRNQYDGMGGPQDMGQGQGQQYPSMVETDGRILSQQQQRPDIYENENSPSPVDYGRPNTVQHQQYEAYQRYLASQSYDSQNYRNGRTNSVTNGYRPSQPPPAPPPNCTVGSPASVQSQHSSLANTPTNMSQIRSSSNRSTPRDTLPPPPPPPPVDNSNMNQFPPPPLDDEPLPPPPPTPIEQNMLRPSSIPEEYLPPSPPPPPAEDLMNQLSPPPPPPLPLPVMKQQMQNGQNGGGGGGSGPSSAKKSSSSKKSTVRDGHSELLKAIRDGIELRKVETKNDTKQEEKPSTYHDVASILARRVAVEMSDSESGSSEYDSDGWDEASA